MFPLLYLTKQVSHLHSKCLDVTLKSKNSFFDCTSKILKISNHIEKNRMQLSNFARHWIALILLQSFYRRTAPRYLRLWHLSIRSYVTILSQHHNWDLLQKIVENPKFESVLIKIQRATIGEMDDIKTCSVERLCSASPHSPEHDTSLSLAEIALKSISTKGPREEYGDVWFIVTTSNEVERLFSKGLQTLTDYKK